MHKRISMSQRILRRLLFREISLKREEQKKSNWYWIFNGLPYNLNKLSSISNVTKRNFLRHSPNTHFLQFAQNVFHYYKEACSYIGPGIRMAVLLNQFRSTHKHFYQHFHLQPLSSLPPPRGQTPPSVLWEDTLGAPAVGSFWRSAVGTYNNWHKREAY